MLLLKQSMVFDRDELKQMNEKIIKKILKEKALSFLILPKHYLLVKSC